MSEEMNRSSAREQMDSNRALWNKWTPIHLDSDFYHVDSFRRGDNRLRDYEIEEVGDVEGKDLLHLQSHFGLDTLSWARLGARVTGVDYSEEGIAAAKDLAREVGLEANFVVSNVYEAPDVLDERFDIVYTSRGVLGWLPDLKRWAKVIAHFLRPGGLFYITEAHPVMWIFDDEEATLKIRYPYFHTDEPLAFPVEGSYVDPKAEVDHDMEYGWTHSLGDIVSVLAEEGLRIDFLHEFPFVDWPLKFLVEASDGTWVLPPEVQGEVPLFFSLKATKPAELKPGARPLPSMYGNPR